MVLRVLGFWLLMLVIAVVAGGARDALLKPRLGDLRAHQVETVAVCLLFFALIVTFVRWTGPTPVQALWIGLAWVLLTVAFETTMVLFILHRPWSAVLADYNILQGRIWGLVLLTVLLGPWLAVRLVG